VTPHGSQERELQVYGKMRRLAGELRQLSGALGILGDESGRMMVAGARAQLFDVCEQWYEALCEASERDEADEPPPPSET
jgi:hypothetical protein